MTEQQVEALKRLNLILAFGLGWVGCAFLHKEKKTLPEYADVDTILSSDETTIVKMMSEMETTYTIEGNPGNGDAILGSIEGGGEVVINGEPESQS